MEVIFSESIRTDEASVVIVVVSDDASNFIESKLQLFTDEKTVQYIRAECKDLSYNKIKSFNVPALDGKFIEIIVACAGKRGTFTRASVEKLGGYVSGAIKSKDAKIGIYNDVESELDMAASYIASGIILKSWVFDKYKTSKVSENKIERIECQSCYLSLNQETFAKLTSIRDGIFLVREMVTEPANIMNSDKFLEISLSLKRLGIKVSVLKKRDMEKLEMNAILGVGRGSDNPTYLITFEYCTDKTKDRIALVGKGLTFDSGGICIKPSNKMGDMKGDMTGAAVVIGVLKSLALQKMKTNVVGVIGVTENMISGSAQRPGDVVVSMSKKTIEVDNTDAEGRLVLADAIWYTHKKYRPKVMIDLATLTGAIQVALGHEFAGLFSNDDGLADDLESSGKNVGEKLWRMPLHPSYENDIKSDIADVKNVGSGRGAGSITAAMFLKEFVPNSMKWAHIDIAATEWDSKDRALSKRGATGFGVRLLNDFIERRHCSRGESGL
ncbi:MAG: leucyl aminopeptidase [Holosporales bacterium]|jgi:leucyl aminopeptidase|nr:leucyl aminopeptidase [Holosporales bacterium]